MYAINYFGMFVRESDGLMTDNKSSAMLFNTEDEAAEYVPQWRVYSGVHQYSGAPVEIVRVETKQVIKKVGKVVRKL